MKPLYFLLFALSPLAAAENIYAPGQAALKFNQWYIAQLDQNKPPVLNPDIMNEYVASGTFDAVCTNVYVAFGKKQDHVIADCLVEEQGKWKVRSATLIK
ncbi:MAG: hypothetical protein E7G64_02565 [Enterobacter hormaechei]|nr:hypothetical protein [Enterobacter hormaechei]